MGGVYFGPYLADGHPSMDGWGGGYSKMVKPKPRSSPVLLPPFSAIVSYTVFQTRD